MAKVQAKAIGGAITEKEASTVSELKTMMGLQSYQASVNGEVVEDEHELEDFEFVTFAPKVKGA